MNEHEQANGHPAGEPPTGGKAPDADAADTAAARVEPAVSGVDFELSEPELGEARISAEAADSVELEKVEAETAEVEREAERSTQLGAAEVISSIAPAAVDFEVPELQRDWKADETNVLRTAGATVPQAPEAHEAPEAHDDGQPGAPEAGPHRVGRGIDDGSGWRRPETPWQQSSTPWQQSSTPWQPKANAWQSPAQHAQGAAAAAAAGAAAAAEGAEGAEGAVGGAQPVPPAGPHHDQPGLPPIPPAPGQPGYSSKPDVSRPGASQPWEQGRLPDGAGQQGTRGKLIIVVGVVIVALILVALLIWLVLGIATGGNKAAAPAVDATTSAATANPADVIAPRASPEDWLAGDCLRGYAGINQAADVVVCNSPHSAQVVGSTRLTASAPFPGDDVLKAQAAAVCQSVQYTDATKSYKGLKEFKAYPSETTWDTANDRRVDCIVTDPTGDHLLTSLIP